MSLWFERVVRFKGHLIDEDLLAELIKENIVVSYYDPETGSSFYGLKPWYRRELYRLAEPQGISSFVFGGRKMTEKKARRGRPRKRPDGRTVPDPEMDLITVKEGDK